MDLGSNFSFNVRVTKRKFNKVRFFSIVFILIVVIAGALFLFNSGIRESISGIFTVAPKSEVAAIDTQQKTNGTKTTENASTKQITTKSGSDTATDATKPNTHEEKNTVPDFSSLKSDLENYISGYQGQYGIHFIDLSTGGEFGINDSETYFAASTIKVPVNLYLYKRIEEGSINPQDTITYNSSIDYEPGTGSLQASKSGTKLVIRDLSELSITVSDNIAVNMLIRLLGKNNYKDYMRQMGGTVVTEKNESCPKDMAIYMKKVYELQQKNKELGDELVGYLENTIFNDGIPKLLPSEVKVAHKIGDFANEKWGTVTNDVGIIYTDKPYVLSVLSKNVNGTEGKEVIANISKKAYDFMVNTNK